MDILQIIRKTAVLALPLLIAGCSSIQPKTRIEVQYRDSIVEHTRIEYRDREVHDTLIVRDSISVSSIIRGDSVINSKESFHFEQTVKVIHDSIYVNLSDTVFVNDTQYVEKEVSVPAKRSKIEIFFTLIGILSLLLILYKLVKLPRTWLSK